ncbi:MAG: 4-(cytidine 5'-diphospho)-2-C-methyl-D-erythritol kinase [Clostridiales bacterium]|nr:4-(cytidine 5'-diphospho)-2-C-methyl-D-erythritol kinase [Clostridiales bacterium]
MRISAKAHAKINWSLDVLNGRDDGYHELDMLMQNVELADELTFQRARWLTLTVNGRALPVGGRNLVVRAANALNEYMGKRHGARITLLKRIPIRAGLGGGSADCAAALVALNRLWELKLPLKKLAEIGKALGADVPYCLAGGFARVAGVGERIERIPGAERFPLLILCAGRGLSTAQVFQEFDRMGEGPMGLDLGALSGAILRRDLGAVGALSGNALEAAAAALNPEVGRAMDALRNSGARAVRMTGSGSAVFGAFRTAAEALSALDRLPGAIFTWTIP